MLVYWRGFWYDLPQMFWYLLPLPLGSNLVWVAYVRICEPLLCLITDGFSFFGEAVFVFGSSLAGLFKCLLMRSR